MRASASFTAVREDRLNPRPMHCRHLIHDRRAMDSSSVLLRAWLRGAGWSLVSAVMGGTPLPVEFQHARVSTAHRQGGSWHPEPPELRALDAFDRVVYAAARTRFLLQIRNVTGGWQCDIDDDERRGAPELMCTRRVLSPFAPSGAAVRSSAGAASESAAVPGAGAILTDLSQAPTAALSGAMLSVSGHGRKRRAASWREAVSTT